MHATEFLKTPEKRELGPVVAVFGDDRHLKQSCLRVIRRLVLGDEEDDAGLTRFPGAESDLKTVCDELRTVSMWADRRLVLVEEADGFVSNNRAGLENYLERPAGKSVLVLEVNSWPKNTRLAKRVGKVGLDLECKELKGQALSRWLSETAREKYGKPLSRDSAALLVELAGTSLGLLDQELAKLSAYVGDRKRIDVDDVQALVGNWTTETTWAMIDAVQDGQIGTALKYLDQLLTAGEKPPKLLGGITFVYRKLARASELARQKTPLRAALSQSGVFPKKVDRAEQYLRRIGWRKASTFYSRLLQADTDLEGGSRVPERVQLERLLVELAGDPAAGWSRR